MYEKVIILKELQPIKRNIRQKKEEGNIIFIYSFYHIADSILLYV